MATPAWQSAPEAAGDHQAAAWMNAPEVSAPKSDNPEKPGFFGTLANDIGNIPHMIGSAYKTVAPYPEDPGVRSAAFHELADPNLNLIRQGAHETTQEGKWLGGPLHIAEGLIPGAGPIAHQAANDFEAGNYGAGAAHMLEVAGPKMLHDYTPPIVPAVAGGAIRGGVKAALEPSTFRGLEIPGGKTMAGAVAGHIAAGPTGAVVGGAVPFVKGAIEGGKQAAARESMLSRIPAPSTEQGPLVGPALSPSVPSMEPITGPLPSGRIPGGIHNVPAPGPVPVPRTPLWAGIQDNPAILPAPLTPPTANAPSSLPSGRIVPPQTVRIAASESPSPPTAPPPIAVSNPTVSMTNSEIPSGTVSGSRPVTFTKGYGRSTGGPTTGGTLATPTAQNAASEAMRQNRLLEVHKARMAGGEPDLAPAPVSVPTTTEDQLRQSIANAQARGTTPPEPRKPGKPLPNEKVRRK